MTRFSLNLDCDVDLGDDGVWKVGHVPMLCSFIFIGGQYSLEHRDAVITLMIVSL